MPRRREVPKRIILPDPLYHNEEVAKFINVLMLAGKKAVAERILYGAFDQIKSKSGKDPVEVSLNCVHRTTAGGGGPCRPSRCMVAKLVTPRNRTGSGVSGVPCAP